MHILVYSMGTKAIRRKAAVHYAAHSLSRGNLKNLMPCSSTFVCQLYFCSSKHNSNKALRITFNSCKTVSTSSMALATVNIDKIIKVTSASSYVYTGSIKTLQTVSIIEAYDTFTAHHTRAKCQKPHRERYHLCG